MTVGEKIQYYRKKFGLSQEELGQKLLVSRQTVSLWEMDKTLPTVDNLIRLKEIFSVPVDEILSDSEITEENTEETKDEVRESYEFESSSSDFAVLSKGLMAPLKKSFILYAISYAIIVIAFVVAQAYVMSAGIVLGFMITDICRRIKGLKRVRKNHSSVEERMMKRRYFYELYDEYIVLKIAAKDEIILTSKFYYSEIALTQVVGDYILFVLGGEECIIKKDALCENSLLWPVINRGKRVSTAEKSKNITKTISIVLFVASIASIFLALSLMTALSDTTSIIPDKMWVLYLFMPIPIASLLFGIFVKHNGCRYKKNIVIGIIMTVILGIYGSFTFAFNDLYSHDDGPIISAEKALNIDIPTHKSINTYNYEDGAHFSTLETTWYFSDIYFDEDAVESFEKALAEDSRWISALPNNLIGIASYYCDPAEDCYYIIYNKTTGEFNQLPDKSGSYEFINVVYDVEANSMKLIEYQLEYVE